MLTEPNGEGMLEANGIDPALAQRIRDGLTTGGVKALATAVDDTIVEKLIQRITYQVCRPSCGGLQRGVSEPQVLLTGEDPSAVFKVLATRNVLA